MNAMVKVRKRRAAALSTPDYGLQRFQLDRPDVVVADRPDPDQPNRTVRGARRVVVYDVLHRSGTISDEQREAADLYLVTALRAEAGTWRPEGRPEAGHVPPWQKGHPAERQVIALAKLRRVNEALGPAATSLLRMFIVANSDLATLAAHYQTNTQVVRGMVMAALTRLEEIYGMNQSVVDRR